MGRHAQPEVPHGVIDIEKLPPHDLEAERSVLGSILIRQDVAGLVAPLVKPDDFYREAHRAIYEAMLAVYERREPPDYITVAQELDRVGKLAFVGGPAYLAELAEYVPTPAHAEHYANIVQRCAIMRRLIDAGGEIAAVGFKNAPDVEQALDEAEQILFGVSQRRTRRDYVALSTALHEYYDELIQIHENQGEVPGLPTGFRDLDALLGGLHPADLIIIAGRPSVGKTSFAMNVVHNIATKFATAVAVFSLEMSVSQLVHRLVSSEAGVDSHRMRTGYLSEYEWQAVSQAMATLSEARVFIDDTANVSTLELRAKARRLKAEQNIGLVVVDYLQLMQGGRGRENRVQEVAEISRGLKALARELEVPVIALSQLSRAVESRQDHRPVLSDLRESGAIEQDADVVMFVHRDELYDRETERKNIADIIVAKHRNGPIGQVPLRFFPNQTRFADLERYRQPE